MSSQKIEIAAAPKLSAVVRMKRGVRAGTALLRRHIDRRHSMPRLPADSDGAKPLGEAGALHETLS